MFVLFGSNKLNGKPVVWDASISVNPHILMIGSSGTGKTYQIRHTIVNQLCRHNLRIHIFDSHGDIEIPPEVSSTVRFAECSEYGVNPFRINSDPFFGGVRRKVNSFISMVNRYSGTLGVRQEAVLRALLYDLYTAYGYESDKPQTWVSSGKGVPTIQSLKDYAKKKIKSLIIGNSGEVLEALESLNKYIAKLDKSLSVEQENMREDETIVGLKDKCKSAFIEYIDKLKTGRELDEYIKYDSKEVMKSVVNRIDALDAMGIFKDKPPKFDLRKPVWRYDIHSLTDGEKGFLVELYLEKIFLWAKQGGLKDVIDTFVIIDEAHKFISKEPDHIVNIIAKEIRKYGVGLLFASQSFSHFTEDVITNCAAKIILGVDEMYHESLSRKLGIKAVRLKYIKPKKTALIQIKGMDERVSSAFYDVILP